MEKILKGLLATIILIGITLLYHYGYKGLNKEERQCFHENRYGSSSFSRCVKKHPKASNSLMVNNCPNKICISNADEK